ncbi:hypothetical protein [Shewanella sp. GXUN23E]|uniref:hypothetical protein n=1 Tax=Shewanella sp. GXUN23E TaxID=3422498 RepID=UPI003D7CACB9
MERVTMLAIAVAVVSLTACSGGRFSSNLEEYGQAKIQSGVVKLYRQDEIFNRNYVALGQVETSFCGDVS